MPIHGSKRMLGETEQIFHSQYGWISLDEFFDLTPDPTEDPEETFEQEPEYLSRLSGESFDHYEKRIRENREYLKPEESD